MVIERLREKGFGISSLDFEAVKMYNQYEEHFNFKDVEGRIFPPEI